MCRLADSIFLALFYMVFFCFVLFLLDTLGTLKQIQVKTGAYVYILKIFIKRI